MIWFNSLLFVALNAYAFMHGYDNAVLYSRRGADAFKKGIFENEHVIFKVEQIFVVIALVASFYMAMLSKIDGLTVTVLFMTLSAFALTFSEIRDWGYYHARMRIDQREAIKNPWNYISPTDTSKLNFSHSSSRALFYLGAFLFIAGCAITIYINKYG